MKSVDLLALSKFVLYTTILGITFGALSGMASYLIFLVVPILNGPQKSVIVPLMFSLGPFIAIWGGLANILTKYDPEKRFSWTKLYILFSMGGLVWGGLIGLVPYLLYFVFPSMGDGMRKLPIMLLPYTGAICGCFLVYKHRKLLDIKQADPSV